MIAIVLMLLCQNAFSRLVLNEIFFSAEKQSQTEFVELHNGVLNPSTAGIHEPQWWSFAFNVVDFGLVYNHQSHIDTNRVSLRYIKGVTSLDLSNYTIPNLGEGPKQVEISQHQHALVTVNADCEMIEWDQ